jgi:hypothetical protein
MYKDRRWGFGKLEWPDGSTYQGIWANDKAEGLGILKQAGGDYYEGSFING